MRKNSAFLWRYLKTFFQESAFFVRFIPTDKCNLNCKYCWQHTAENTIMSKEEFDLCLKKARKLNVGFIDFLGGEPLLWPHLIYAIQQCTKHNIKTNLTTNGSLLTENKIKELGQAKLDYLNISVDNFDNDNISLKNYIFKNGTITNLLQLRALYKTKIRVNTVLYKNNFYQIKKMIERLHSYQIPISIGLVLSNHTTNTDNTHCFSNEDKKELVQISEAIVNMKRNGYKIIDPDDYFTNIPKYLNKEKFWQCNYPTKFGWINIIHNGKIRSCTKKMNEEQINFHDLNKQTLTKLRMQYQEKVKSCNHLCYSNCAYDSWYFRKHKLKFFLNHLKNL